MFDVYRQSHPWVADHPLRPKSVARDLYERAMDFADYVRHYELARSEGTVLRYLTDAYKTLVRTIPEDAQDRRAASTSPSGSASWSARSTRSLLDEWEELRDPSRAAGRRAPPIDRPPPPVTANRRAFTCWCATPCSSGSSSSATRQWHELEALDGDDGWTAERWFEALAPVLRGARHARHRPRRPQPGAAPDRRAPVDHPGCWRVRQILDDPAGDHDWRITAVVDLAASDEAGRAVVRILDAAPHT